MVKSEPLSSFRKASRERHLAVNHDPDLVAGQYWGVPITSPKPLFYRYKMGIMTSAFFFLGILLRLCVCMHAGFIFNFRIIENVYKMSNTVRFTQKVLHAQ